MAGTKWRTPNRSPSERGRGGCSRMETGGYVRCFVIVAGERHHPFGFESHPPHRASPGRIVLAWGYVFPGTVCGACTPTADPCVGRWSRSVCCPAGERVPRPQRVDGRAPRRLLAMRRSRGCLTRSGRGGPGRCPGPPLPLRKAIRAGLRMWWGRCHGCAVCAPARGAGELRRTRCPLLASGGAVRSAARTGGRGSSPACRRHGGCPTWRSGGSRRTRRRCGTESGRPRNRARKEGPGGASPAPRR
ncbi:hypothetical protein DER30_4660 [Streptomyces sp. HB202]|nr:hypothetical protein DER30_4660 [Streptomyces sp. HB202]